MYQSHVDFQRNPIHQSHTETSEQDMFSGRVGSNNNAYHYDSSIIQTKKPKNMYRNLRLGSLHKSIVHGSEY